MKNKNLVNARNKKNLSQEQLAKMLGYKGKQAVCNWENGYSSPPLDKAIKAAEILGADISFLFGQKVQENHTKGGG
ncbi:helix-turn-helix transcriptional regulator [Caldifermentibacillus hisashii]|uniref:helix-turn-helix transcriptional regulator n=1 Tax=Bacillaceae TaxID=186817 RepID=UPI00203EF61D|nr:helix-turn-helix transcriptional regulator [Caldibacillus thermoamylovorans]MCM3053700.1 helix-turn-helix domain-containing protein [Caldibacillus thermoamylovorans]